MPPVMEQVIRHDAVECSRVSAVGSRYPKHTHEEYVISANLQGHERIWMGGQEHDVGAHHVTIYNPLTVQASTFSPAGAQFVSVHLGQQQLLNALAGSGLKTLPVFEEGVINDAALTRAIVELYRSAQSEPPEEALLALLGELWRFETRGERPIEPVRIARLIEFMNDNLYQTLNLEDLCAQANLSKFHLVRSFKSSKHLAPMQYFKQLRLIEARKRLRHGDQPAQIAADLGFFDQGHLSNSFRQVMGIAPGSYSSMLDHA